jgi:aspartate 1-decarboxylase
VCVNGAGAHLVRPGDLVIVATYTMMSTRTARKYEPTIVFVDAANKLREADAAEVVAAMTEI